MGTLFYGQQTVVLTREGLVHYFLPNIVSIKISCNGGPTNIESQPWPLTHMGIYPYGSPPTLASQFCSNLFTWEPHPPNLFKPFHFGKWAVGRGLKSLLVVTFVTHINPLSGLSCTHLSCTYSEALWLCGFHVPRLGTHVMTIFRILCLRTN